MSKKYKHPSTFEVRTAFGKGKDTIAAGPLPVKTYSRLLRLVDSSLKGTYRADVGIQASDCGSEMVLIDIDFAPYVEDTAHVVLLCLALSIKETVKPTAFSVKHAAKDYKEYAVLPEGWTDLSGRYFSVFVGMNGLRPIEPQMQYLFDLRSKRMPGKTARAELKKWTDMARSLLGLETPLSHKALRKAFRKEISDYGVPIKPEA